MDKIAAPGTRNTRDGRERRWTAVVHRNGKWWCKGKSYDTLHEALTTIWPE